MSLILTQINRYGIVFAADSNITVNESETKRGKKIFELPRLKAALCLAGAHSVGNTRMDGWITHYIKNDKSKSIKEFTENLCNALEKEMTIEERASGCIMHISGFVKENNVVHPEMWGISNVNLLPNGEYTVRDKFESREDFWNRDWKKNNIKNLFASPIGYGHQYYINGFTAGRVSFNVLSKYLNDFLIQIWSRRNYKFRPPQKIEEYESLARFAMGFIALMFNLSDYSPRYIGGKILSYVIKSPDPKWFTQLSKNLNSKK